MICRFNNHAFAVVAAFAAMIGGFGCCRGREAPAMPATLDEALDYALSLATDEDAVDEGGAPAAKANPLPSEEDAKTNLVARFTLQLRDNAAEMAKLAERRAAALEAAREDPAFEAAYAEAVAARKRYDDLVSANPSIREIDGELARLRRERGALIRARERFEGKSVSRKVSK